MRPFRLFRAPRYLLVVLVLASGCVEPVSPGSIEGTTVVVRNELVMPVTVRINGIDVGVVGAGQERTIQRGDLAEVVVDWAIVRSKLGDRALGDSLGARFSIDSPLDGDEHRLAIDNIITVGAEEIVYYSPVVSNATADAIAVGFDMGSARELRYGELGAGVRNRVVGYFRLDDTTGIRAYRPRVAYGPMLFIERAYGRDFDLGDLLDGSGELSVVFDSDPP
jgi:hypothetical protein